MKVGLSGGGLWRLAYRVGLARARMPQWRVVVDARPANSMSAADGTPVAGAVTGVLVWAHDAEEAEALARLAIEDDGFEAITADAAEIAPQSAPSQVAKAVARTGFALYGADVSDTERAR